MGTYLVNHTVRTPLHVEHVLSVSDIHLVVIFVGLKPLEEFLEFSLAVIFLVFNHIFISFVQRYGKVGTRPNKSVLAGQSKSFVSIGNSLMTDLGSI